MLTGWFESLDADLFQNGLTRFREAHETIKGLFFWFVNQILLSKLNPTFE